MSINLGNRYMLRALGRALAEQAKAALDESQRHSAAGQPSNAVGTAEAARLLTYLADACTDAAADLAAQDRGTIG